MPECLVTPEHTHDYFHMLFYIVYTQPKQHSYPIVTIEGYVWCKCGPDDEVLYSTSFQALIETILICNN